MALEQLEGKEVNQVVLDVFQTITIDGKEYKLGFPNRVLFQAEQEITGGNLIKLLAFPPPSMGDTFVLFKWALIGGGHKMSDEEVDELFNNALAEHNGFIGVSQIVFEALAKAAPMQKTKKA